MGCENYVEGKETKQSPLLLSLHLSKGNSKKCKKFKLWDYINKIQGNTRPASSIVLLKTVP